MCKTLNLIPSTTHEAKRTRPFLPLDSRTRHRHDLTPYARLSTQVGNGAGSSSTVSCCILSTPYLPCLPFSQYGSPSSMWKRLFPKGFLQAAQTKQVVCHVCLRARITSWRGESGFRTEHFPGLLSKSPREWGNRAQKVGAGEDRGGWRREVRLIRATLPKGYGELGAQAGDWSGCEAPTCFVEPRHHLKLVAHVYSIPCPS